MADVYCDDGGSNTSPYETWAKAATSILTALTQAAAGEIIYIASDHVENFASSQTVASANGTLADPVKIISADQTSGEPPTTFETMLSQSGSMNVTGAGNDLTMNGGDIWVGCYFTAADNTTYSPDQVELKFINSKVQTGGTFLTTQSNSEGGLIFENCDIEFSASGEFALSGNQFRWSGGTLSYSDSGVVNPAFLTMDTGTHRAGNYIVEDVDLSVIGAGDYVLGNLRSSGLFRIRRCKVGASLGGLVESAPTRSGTRIEIESCSSDDIIYQFHHESYWGTVEDDTDIYLDATYDGTNGYSAKMVSSADTAEFTRPLRFKLADIFVDATGKTLTVELLTTDAATAVALNDDDFWIEVEYPDSTVAAFNNVLTTRMTDILTTPTALTASAKGTGDWTGELADNNFYKVVADFTGVADEAIGAYRVWVCLARPSTTVYVDPKIVVT